MERLNKKTLSFPAKTFTRSIAALGMALALVACGNKGGGSGTTVTTPPVYGNGCSNCAASIANPVVLTTFQMQSLEGDVVLSNMQLVGQSSLIQPNVSGNNFRNYVGPVAAHGQLIVTSSVRDPMNAACVIHPGTYSIQTSAVGQMGIAGGDITLPKLVATTGGIELRIDEGVLFDLGERLYARVTILKVNGSVCSQSFSEYFN